MTTASLITVQVLEQIVKFVPVGTNLALLQLMWAMISGSFLSSRGAVHSALGKSGFESGEIRWQSHEYGGFRAVAVDTTAYWRPRLRGWPGKLYRQLTGKTMIGCLR